jgi:hypothetical protein
LILELELRKLMYPSLRDVFMGIEDVKEGQIMMMYGHHALRQ